MTAESFLEAKARQTEESIRDYLGAFTAAPPRLIEAIRYSLFAPAKRLRPALALGSAELICGDDAPGLPAACALEMIHTYSLIHDDLPCMDDDAMRRGQPSCHTAFGEAIAILAGDTLLTMAFELLAETGNAEVISDVARAAGPLGMAGGQVLDLDAEGKSLDVTALRRVHDMKTGALIRASVRSGAMLAGADEASLAALTRYGEHLGLAFQITDDLLDEEGDPATMGKAAGSDAARGKSTYPACVGRDESLRLARESVDRAIAELDRFGADSAPLCALAEYTIRRKW